MDKQVINGVIKYLYGHDHYLPAAWLYQYGNDNKPVTDLALVISELNRLNLIEMRYDKSGHEEYLLSVPARLQVENLPKEFQDDPYGYFTARVDSHNAITEERLTLELQKLRNEIKDRPTGLRISKLSLGISLAAIVITVLTVFFTRYKIWPFDK